MMKNEMMTPNEGNERSSVEKVTVDKDTLEVAISALGKMLAQANLDNTQRIAGVLEGDQDDMPMHRQRVIIGYNDDGTPIYKRLQAKTEEDLSDRIVATYVESGRISEFMDMRSDGKPKTHTPFREYAKNWMEIYKKPKLKPRTYQTYHNYMHAHLLPAFGDRFIEDITSADIQKFLNDRKNLSRKSLKNYLNLLQQIFDAAKEDKLITESPTASKRLTNPSTTLHPREALTDEQYRSVLTQLMALEPCPEKLLLGVLIFTGVRRGEALGLMWEDIDFENKIIHIRRNVTHPQNAPVIGTPKTASGYRDLPFGHHFEQILLSMRKESGFLFGGEHPYSVHSYDTVMKHIRKRVNLYGATAHVLRHTYLTNLAASNVDLKTLQTIAGHANSQTTMNIYVHPKMENICAASRQMDEMLGGYAAV